MKLVAFQIRNFRSIVNSQLNNLAWDNITALIGQNESGKTSVLEALNCFYTGQINDDMLRSDLSLPEVSCEFEIESNEIQDVTRLEGLPSEVAEIIKSEKRVLLIRQWNQEKSSTIRLGGDRVDVFYSSSLNKYNAEELEILKLSQEILKEEEDTMQVLVQIEKEREQINKRAQLSNKKSEELSRRLKKNKDDSKKEAILLELDQLSLEQGRLRSLLEGFENQKNNLKSKLQGLTDKAFYARNVQQAVQKFNQAAQSLEISKTELAQIEKERKQVANEKLIKQIEHKIQMADQRFREFYSDYKSSRQEAVYTVKLMSFFLRGMSAEQARSESSRQTAQFTGILMPDEIGPALFNYVPEFEFFEDFSSLLPNRIDLADLVHENSSAEGYKAARNFLIIAGIEPEFFSQQNNRILKQKIETLNGEITVNFQDYWRQNVGKNNKIKLQFELEHYDASHPEKKGLPYLEFWIKDERERLYPKQRSRGVRWFLSFYLELKATAKRVPQKRVLLIDEPGISLHARAQEDVLKVFEDLKDYLMIIYTTHSPHLINVNKLYRILAVQRADESDEKSESMVLNSKVLARASADTLSPIYALMGARITDQQYIRQKNNIILEEISSYYLMNAYFHLLEIAEEVSFLPATDSSGVAILANLLTGWKLDFIILTNDNDPGNIVRNELKITLFAGDENALHYKLLSVENGNCLIDLLSTIDFKNHVLNKRVGITETNSDYIALNDLSPSFLAMEFYNKVSEGKISWQDLDDESHQRIGDLVKRIISALKREKP